MDTLFDVVFPLPYGTLTSSYRVNRSKGVGRSSNLRALRGHIDTDERLVSWNAINGKRRRRGWRGWQEERGNIVGGNGFVSGRKCLLSKLCSNNYINSSE